MSGRFIAAIDQGTTSSRCMIFELSGAIVAAAQANLGKVGCGACHGPFREKLPG